MEYKFLNNNQTEKILEKLEYYGIKNVNLKLVKPGKEKIRGYSGNLTEREINWINKIAQTNTLGLYLFHEYENEIRLSIEAIHIFKEQITKNILEINDTQFNEWFNGQDLFLSDSEKEKLSQEEKGFKVIKYKNDFIGAGKFIGDRIVNYLPKERRRKIQR